MVEEEATINVISKDAIASERAKLQELKKIKLEEEKIKAKIPKGGRSPIQTQSVENRGGIFRGQTDTKIKIKDKTSNQAFVRVSEFKKSQKKLKKIRG